MSSEQDSRSPLGVSGANAFVAQVARYYRDFLETDFRKSRAPARQVRVRDESGSTLGFNVRRYPELFVAIAKLLETPFEGEVSISIGRGQFSQRVSENVQRLLRAQVAALDDAALREIVNNCVYSLKQRAPAAADNFDRFIDDAQELISERVMRFVVEPLIKTLEGVLANQPSINVNELLYEIEDDIAEHITGAIRENLPDALVELVQSGNLVPVATLLNETIGPSPLREFLVEFFASLATSDAYEELLAVANTLRVNESLEVYLYLIDLVIEPHQFPVAYIPVRLQKAGDRFVLSLDNRLFFNRRALKYAVDRNPEAGLRVPGKPTDDRIHFLFEASPLSFIEDAILAITDAYKLSEQVPALSRELRHARTPVLAMSNAVHICAFPKGEEAIVNDYEEILVESAKADSPLAELFRSLISGCVLEEPRSIRADVEGQWEATPRDVRLVYESPVPLNEEQRKLLIALQNPKCRYAVVEGPPGTGKSHTITALVFDAIMRDRSVLVLSDKTEALDVVEDKLTQSLSAIRPAEEFQNPILRLGRTSGTYNKILKKSARERIQHFFTAAKAQRERARPKTQAQTEQLRRDINKTVDHLASIDIAAVHEYERLLTDLGIGEPEALDINHEVETEFAALLELLESLPTEARRELAELADASAEKLNFSLDQRLLEADVSRTYPVELGHLGQFDRISVEHLAWFKRLTDELREMRNPVFGYLFKGDALRTLSLQLAERMPLAGLQPAHKRCKSLGRAADLLVEIESRAKRFRLPSEALAAALERLRKGPIESSVTVERKEAVLRLANFGRRAARLLEATWDAPPSLADWIRLEPALKAQADRLLSAIRHFNRLAGSFAQIPRLDLQKTQAILQHEHAADLAHRLDKNVLDFIAESGALATTLGALIRQRQPFPRDRFDQLKKAFPCMIAGIREFADYIPLAPDLIDLVIIDEASQVSIAQAFPAILRAKQVVVFGDEQQFANVKTSTASRAVNQSYMNELEEVFRANFDVDTERLERMKRFDVRTSILRFFDLVKHFDVMLKKHFRGYAELISFSSKYFYKGGLQAIRIRARPVSEVLKFTVLSDSVIPPATHRNANAAEVDFIHEELKALLEMQEPPTVAVITPFREQQKLATTMLLFDSPFGDDFRERLSLKVMTFDTCQGEERDIIYYSMASTANHDRLNYIFPTTLEEYDEGVDRIKIQRLNVGFSRAKETIHFVLSKPMEAYKGTVREVLRHYDRELANARALPTVDQVDANSPMEAQVLHWLRNTLFYKQHADRLEIVPQFPIGDYLRQLDPYYEHPRYRVDFLLLYKHPNGRKVPVIIEYDGFREHFRSGARIDASNYEYYYREEDVERQFVLESYGYNFLRINRFNLGADPVATLSERLSRLIETRTEDVATSEYTEAAIKMATALAEGLAKLCKKCGKPKDLREFQRSELRSGVGRYCNACDRLYA